MNCTRFAKLLPLYVEGDLDAPTASDAASHERSCEECARLTGAHVASQEWLRSYEPPTPDEDRLAASRRMVLQQLSAAHPRNGFLKLMGGNSKFMSLAAAAVILIAAIGFGLVAVTRQKHTPKEQLAELTHTVEREHPASNPPNEDGKQPRSNTNIPVDRSSKSNRRPVRPQIQPPATTEPVTLASSSANWIDGDEMLRIEIETSDPAIRIIWFAPKPAEADER